MSEFQEKYHTMGKDMRAFDKQHPEFLDAAREALIPWEKNQQVLMHAIAVALLEMYERGVAGDRPEILIPRGEAPPPATVVRRARIVAPAPAPTVVRRGRRIL